ncbi:MAG: hypothetical protein OHK0021_04270 [Bryobacter sp.]
MSRFAARVVLLCLSTLVAWGQLKMSAGQLMGFVRSSLRLKHSDEQVAKYLKKVVLTQQLSPGYVENLLGEGVGPKTYEQLMTMSKASVALPLPADAKKASARPTPIPPPSREEQQKLLGELREYALAYDKSLPDFICTQVTRRFYDPSGLEYWVSADTITAKLSYFQNKEEKKVLFVNNRYQDVDWDKLGGATSTGEFGNLLREIFEPTTQTDFLWERWGTLRGKRNHVFRYRVSKSTSQWSIVYEKSMSIQPGYTGFIYADADNGMITRVTLEAQEIPSYFPIQMAKTQLDYDYTDIAGNTYLLPLRAEVKMREGKNLVRNDIEFRNYRKFGADTSITFDTPEPLSSDVINETPTEGQAKEALQQEKPQVEKPPAGQTVREIPKEGAPKPAKP